MSKLIIHNKGELVLVNFTYILKDINDLFLGTGNKYIRAFYCSYLLKE